jgi:hypothetical protein
MDSKRKRADKGIKTSAIHKAAGVITSRVPGSRFLFFCRIENNFAEQHWQMC